MNKFFLSEYFKTAGIERSLKYGIAYMYNKFSNKKTAFKKAVI